MQQAEKRHRVSELQVFARCLKIQEMPMEWADEQGQLPLHSVKWNVKNNFPADPRKATCNALQSLGENPAR